MSFTNYIPYPEGLPPPSADFSGQYNEQTVSTTFTSGRRRKRKIGRTAVKSVALQWLFTPEEFDLFEVWYRAELNDGCDKFKIEMCTGGPSQTGIHVVQCVGQGYSYSHEECNWRVSVDCIIYPYPTMEVDSLLEGYLGATVDSINYSLNKYYDKRYQA